MNKPNRTINSVSIITVSEERGLNLNNQPSMSEQKKNSSDFPQDNEWEQVAIVFCEKFDNGHALKNLDKKQKQPVTSAMQNSSIPDDSNMKQKLPVTSAMKKPSIPEDSNKKQPVTSAMKQMTTAEDLKTVKELMTTAEDLKTVKVDSNKSKTISEEDSNKKQLVTSAMKQMTTAEDLKTVKELMTTAEDLKTVKVDSNKSKTISEDELIEEMEYAFEQELYDSAGVGPELNQKK